MMKSSLTESKERDGHGCASSDARGSFRLAERLTTLTLANGSIVGLLYDNANRLLYKGDPSPTSGIGYGYTLDLNGNRVTITVNDGSVTENVCDNTNPGEVRTDGSP